MHDTSIGMSSSGRWSILSDKMHRFPGLVAAWHRLAAGGFQHSGQIVGQCAHCLQALGIQSSLTGLAAIDDIPVLRRNNRHIHQHKWHIQGLKSGGGTPSAADGYCSGRLALECRAIGIQHPLDDGHQRSVGLAIIYRRTNDECIGLIHLGRYAIADVIVENAGAGLFPARVAGNAPPNGFVANPDHFALNAMLFKLLGNFCQSDGCIALGTGAAVYHQDLHNNAMFLTICKFNQNLRSYQDSLFQIKCVN